MRYQLTILIGTLLLAASCQSGREAKEESKEEEKQEAIHTQLYEKRKTTLNAPDTHRSRATAPPEGTQ